MTISPVTPATRWRPPSLLGLKDDELRREADMALQRAFDAIYSLANQVATLQKKAGLPVVGV